VEINSDKADITRANHQIEALEDRIKVLQRELQGKDDQMIGMKQANSLSSNQLEAKNAEIKKLSKKIEGSLKDVSVARADLMNEQKEVSILSKKNHQLQKEIESLRLSLENSMS
jgi:chromosome segregation ATPase